MQHYCKSQRSAFLKSYVYGRKWIYSTVVHTVFGKIWLSAIVTKASAYQRFFRFHTMSGAPNYNGRKSVEQIRFLPLKMFYRVNRTNGGLKASRRMPRKLLCVGTVIRNLQNRVGYHLKGNWMSNIVLLDLKFTHTGWAVETFNLKVRVTFDYFG